jgi:hypothetical protein
MKPYYARGTQNSRGKENASAPKWRPVLLLSVELIDQPPIVRLMDPWTNIACLLCGDPASDRTPPGFNGVVVRCHSCRDYDVTGTILTSLYALSVEERFELLRAARDHAAIGTRPSINAGALAAIVRS